MPAAEEESKMKQDREKGQAEKDSRGNTIVKRRGGLEERRRKQNGQRGEEKDLSGRQAGRTEEKM